MDLHNEKRITYVIFLSGCDFFVASPFSDIDLKIFGLVTEYKSYLYTPVYTVPRGWKQPLDKCLENMVKCEFRGGTLERTVEKKLDWNEKDWEIYRFMQANIREKWVKLAKEVNLSLSTARKSFFSHILPECYQAHYFFPGGYDYYGKMILRVRTKCEIGSIPSSTGSKGQPFRSFTLITSWNHGYYALYSFCHFLVRQELDNSQISKE